MNQIKIVEVKEDLLAKNEEIAIDLRKTLKEKHIFLLNVMASPGSGKTTLLIRLIEELKSQGVRIGVLEADIDSDVDAKKMEELTGVQTLQIHTGGACHLTAQMVNDAIKEFNLSDIDLLILENVGNLVCPAEFDTGANLNMMLLSVPEGDDKPLKYPLMFEVSNIAVITKIDTLPVFDFDIEKCKERILKRNPKAKIFVTSALKNEGIEPLSNYLHSLIL